MTTKQEIRNKFKSIIENDKIIIERIEVYCCHYCGNIVAYDEVECIKCEYKNISPIIRSRQEINVTVDKFHELFKDKNLTQTSLNSSTQSSVGGWKKHIDKWKKDKII